MTGTSAYGGQCHCGAIGYTYRTALDPSEWAMREDQCRFCRAHAALSTSDPRGELEFAEAAAGALVAYRFGQRTADFLLCARCGVYMGAAIETPAGRFGIINARALCEQRPLPAAAPVSYDGETREQRTHRRIERWTPIVRIARTGRVHVPADDG